MTSRSLRPGRLRVALPSLPIALLCFGACAPSPEESAAATLELRDGWRIAAAAEVSGAPEEVSSAGFDTSAWTATTVPATVMAALVRSGELPDPYFGKRLEQIPAERFQSPWWYRTEFQLDAPPGPGARLVLDGINYSADLWINGQQVAGRDDLLGAFRTFDLEVSDHLTAGANTLAILVHPPQPGDPTIGFVDWNPTSPDRNMGLWRGVRLRLTGGVGVDDVFVRSDLDLDSLDRASLTVEATLRNHTGQPVEAVVEGAISGGIQLRRTETLAPGEERQIQFTPQEYPQLVVDNPRLWWPHDMGEPHLYDLELTTAVGGPITDRREVGFGIRDGGDYMTEEGYRGYTVNGRKVLIRGGGWVDDMMLADTPRKVEDQLRYVRHMNLNTIRLEGFWGSGPELYDLADRYGILVMVGWSCQWEWEDYLGGPVDEYGGIDTPEEMSLIARSLRDQVLWLRNHPSVLVWVLASDMLPRPELERKYYAELAEVDPTRPALAACSVRVSEVSGPSGVKMNGPYDWVPPHYWYVDRERGGAYGFNTETGPGPQPPPAGSIRRMLPEENWWPIDEMWEYHCGRNQFNTLDRYQEALDARYGPSDSLDEFARKAQVANYEGMRAMFESFSIRRPQTTGLIQWMLNSAWPEMYWQLYDYYLVPNGAFYGARDASRPLNVAYDYADRGVVVVNDTDQPLSGATLRVRVLDLGSQVLFDRSEPVTAAPGTIQRPLSVPEFPQAAGEAYFVHLQLADAGGDEQASSLYWLSTKPEVLDWEATEWFVTPTAEYADLTGLERLPEAAIEVEHTWTATDDGWTVDVRLDNPTDRLAFFIELSVVGSESGGLAAPILWSDNYVSLLPGESREVRGTVPAHALEGEQPVFRFSGVNVTGG